MWVARDRDGGLHVFWEKPRRENGTFEPRNGDVKTPFCDSRNYYKNLLFAHGAKRCTLFKLLLLLE